MLAILATTEVIVLTSDMTPAQAGSNAAEVTDKADMHEIRVTVNGQFVVLTSREVTGLQVKEAAIAAGIPIQLDFVLSEVRPSGEQKIIPDDREITVKSGDEFWAIPGDDNS
jgi:Multiubiquitin